MGAQAGEVELPLIHCPFEPAIHPRVRQVEQRAVEWIERSGMCPDARERAWVIASHSADFYARFAPFAPDEDRLLAPVLWVYWGFAFDDGRCDAGYYQARPAEFTRLAGRVQRALESPSADHPEDPLIPALQGISGMLTSTGQWTAFRRFVAAHRAWLTGVSWQIGNAAAGRLPGLDEYLAQRVLSAGGEPPFALWELANGIDVPGRDMDRPAVRALTELAITVAALDNDRHSLRKEVARGQTEQNIYTVLMRERDLTLQDAVHEATRIRDRVQNRFRQLLDAVRPYASTELAAYLGGLCHGIRGNAEWGLRVPRYLSLGVTPGDRDDDSFIEWAPEPSDPSLEPLQLPSVAWWWDRELA